MGDHRGIAPMHMQGNIAENWKIWRSRFENYLVASEINKKEEAVQCAQVLHFIGEEGFKIYTTLKLEEDQKNKLKVLLDKFEAHFLPKENIAYKRYTFFSYKQQPSQTLEPYVTEIKKLAMKCKLDLQEDLTETVLICGVNKSTIRERLLQEEETLTLDKAIEKCAIIEMARETNEGLASGFQENTTCKLEVDDLNKWKKQQQNSSAGSQKTTNNMINSCQRCGILHVINKCPAFGKECNYCHYKNHFEAQCFKKKNKVNEVVNSVNEIRQESSINENDILFIGSVETSYW